MALHNTLNFFTYEQLSVYRHEEIDGTIYFSVKTAITYDRNNITNRPSENVCEVEFVCTSDIDQWECRATREEEASGSGIGLLIKNGTEVLTDESVTFPIKHTQLTLGDGRYRISVYVMKDGIWYE